MTVGMLEPQKLARRAGLIYVNGDAEGIERRRCGRGFYYLYRSGRPVRSAGELERIRFLAIPPAWEDVWICRHPEGHLQATGRDDRGRKQYIYHDRWQETSSRVKFSGLAELAEVLPRIRREVCRRLEAGDERDRLLALLVRILDLTGMRVGNEEYAKDNDSYGLTTLRKRHLHANGAGIEFRYTGKSGQKQVIAVSDPVVTRLVTEFHRQPGRLLFQYQNGRGPTPLTSADVNDFLHNVSRNGVTAKDFRTWKGTVLATAALCEQTVAERLTHRKRAVKETVCHVAEYLGNTPTVCRNYYVHPGIVDAYIDGRFSRICSSFEPRRRRWLSREEQLLGHFLDRL
jgi:DNA topoisomerase-1